MARSFDSCGIVSAWKVFNLMLMSSGILILTCALYSVSFSCSAVIKSKPGSVLLQKRQYFPGRNEFFETNSNYVNTDDVAREKTDMSSPATALKFESSDVRYIHENGAKPRVQNPNSLLDGSDSKYATEDTRNIAQIGDSTYELFENRQYREMTESASPVYSNNQISPGLVRTRFGGIRKLPSAIIIGVKKGGTRALLEFLRIHPDVRAPGPEIHFFDRHYDLGLDWYRRRMPSTLPGQVTMEKTPCYFVTKDAPKRISAMSKAVKLIIVVRDPVTRAISDYTQTASKRPSQKPFEAMAFLNNSTIVDASWGAIRIGMYAKHIERWLRHFQLEQMHFVSGERLISDPAGVMADVQDFLGLKRIINEKHFYFNETKGFPCLKKGEGNATPHCLGKTKGRQHPAIDPKAMKRLRDFFRPFNQKFYQTVNKDFGWP